jgi:hypothetical protein
LKVHNMSEGGTKQAAIAENVAISLRSEERILEEEVSPRSARPDRATRRAQSSASSAT